MKKYTSQASYIERLKKLIRKMELEQEKAFEEQPENRFYIGSIGGQLTVLKRELEYLRQHNMELTDTEQVFIEVGIDELDNSNNWTSDLNLTDISRVQLGMESLREKYFTKKQNKK